MTFRTQAGADALDAGEGYGIDGSDDDTARLFDLSRDGFECKQARGGGGGVGRACLPPRSPVLKSGEGLAKPCPQR